MNFGGGILTRKPQTGKSSASMRAADTKGDPKWLM